MKTDVAIATIATLILVGLRAGEVIDIPWVWVFSPIWIPAALLALALLAVAIITMSERGGNRH